MTTLYKVTYFKETNFDASLDIPKHIYIPADNYEEVVHLFKLMEIGYIWSVDEA